MSEATLMHVIIIHVDLTRILSSRMRITRFGGQQYMSLPVGAPLKEGRVGLLPLDTLPPRKDMVPEIPYPHSSRTDTRL